MTAKPALPPVAAPASEDGTLLSFPKGLVGFPQFTAYRLFEPKDGFPLKFLQAVGAEEVSFTCIDPVSIKSDFEVPLASEDAEALGLETPEDAMVLTLVVVPENPRRMTANLAGPLVINIKTKRGFQIVLNAEQYPLRFPILPQD